MKLKMMLIAAVAGRLALPAVAGRLALPAVAGRLALPAVAGRLALPAGAQAETYHVRRGGMENARFDLKADRRGYQWLSFAAYEDSFWRKGGALTDYPKQMEAELKTLYGGKPRCNKTGYAADLWWAQYRPGGRVSSTHTVCWDSNIMKDAAKKDPAVAALQFEVIIRQAMAYNPRQSWLVVHGDDPEAVAEYKAGREPITVQIAEKVAAHYGLPTLNLANAAANGGAEAVSAAVTAFVNDVLNPSAIPAKVVSRKPPEPLAKGLNAQCHMVAYDDGSVRNIGKWRQGVAPPNKKYMSSMTPGVVGDRMEMEFRGTEVGLLDFSCAGGAEYAWRVDGGEWRTIPASAEPRPEERHLRLASGLARSGAVSADSDAVRHVVELKVTRLGGGCVIGFALNGSTADEDAGTGKEIKKVADIDRQYAALKPLKYEPPVGRHALIPKTMKRLQDGPSLRIVCLGDSIISDTCKSKFELLLERMYKKCKVAAVCSARSSTGCWWYKDENRVDGWVFSHKPDLLVIGGVSQKDDVESIRSVIRQCRAKDSSLEILVMSPVFGEEGSTKVHAWNVGWNYDPDKAQHPFRRQLRDMCAEEKVAFFDINAPWRQYVIDSGMDVGYYHRDGVHSNLRGQVVIGKLIGKWFELESGACPCSSSISVHGEGADRVVTVDVSGCGDFKALWRLIGEARKASPGGRIVLTGKRPKAISWSVPAMGYPYAESAADCKAAVDFYLGKLEKPSAKAAAKAALASVPEVVYVTHAAFRQDHHNTATLFQCGEINERSYCTSGALKAWNPATGTTRVIVPEKAGRTVRDPEIDWDGRRIVFSMRDGAADDYHIYVVNADGTGLRQLTRAKGVSDIDPALLPDGGIVFSSTRDPKYCMCNRHIMCNLYRMDADGANIHQIGKSTLFEGHSSILPDGRVLYDRWEYVDRDFGDAQGLWTCNPDGTRHAIWWGNNTTSPGGVVNARAVGGDSSKAIAILGSCHDRPWGALGLIDRSLGVDGQEPVLRTWPAFYRERIHSGGKEDFDSTRFLPCKYADPFPIDETRFLAVRQTGRADGEMALVYLDLDGNETELLTDAPGIWSPVILRSVKKPVVQSQQRNFDAPDAPGRFYLQNVYIGTHMKGVKPGTVKALRIVESPEKRNWTRPSGWFGHGEEAPAMNWHSFENKRILGTVPVEADGSAYFEVPGNTFVYFQALDEKGMMVQSMRSGAYVQPGETYGCVGCHENRVGEAAPVTERPLAMRRAPSKLNGWYGPARLFSFQKEVQPVFTKNCLACHDYGGKAAEKLNLSGDMGAFFCTSYVDLWATGAIKCIGGGPAEIQPAYSWGAHASKLTKALYGHGKTNLTDEERDRVITWMDINAVYYPRYESAYPDNLGGRMPLSIEEKEQLEKLCGKKIANSYGKRQREQLDFERLKCSRILDGVAGAAAYAEALAIIQKGGERLKAKSRGDVEEGFVPCAKDLERDARHQRRLAQERRVYEAIKSGKKVYDE